MNTITQTLAVAAALTIAGAALAADDHAGHGQAHGAGGSHAAAPAGQSTDTVEGEVRRIDKAGGKLTIKHGPIRHLDMPPMTMDFTARDPGLLEGVRRGDRIRFTADEIDGKLTITGIERGR
ncbi:MAG: copper-binding protein [Burkholderiaceae bacterium]